MTTSGVEYLHKNEQLIHTSRYIHLNPYSGGMINKISDVLSFPLSSMDEYINGPKLCNTDTVLAYFDKNPSLYTKFVLNNADYQKHLEEYKYTEKW